MNIHEYQAKSVLAKYGVAVPKGGVAYTAAEASEVAKSLEGPVFVVKSQIHAGGRGAGRFKNDPDGKGGVRVVKSIDEVGPNAEAMLNQILVTKQTGPDGKEVKRIYVEEGCDIKRELYLSVLVDRAAGQVTIVASTEGGMDIATVAAETPAKIMKVSVDPASGMSGFHARRSAFGLGLEGDQIKSAVKFLTGIYKAFTELDMALLEINPLVVTGSGDVLALDAKFNFDDNGLFRHKDIQALFDPTEENPLEMRAARMDLNYIALDGEIGCIVREPVEDSVRLSTGEVLEPPDLASHGVVVSAVRRLAVEDTYRSFAALGLWMERTGHVMGGPSREAFLEPPSAEGVAVI